MNIFRPNFHYNSYIDGFQDGEKGTPSDYTQSPVFKALLTEHAINTFIGGYNDGYRDGKEKIYNS